MRSTELGWLLVKQPKAHTLQMKIWVEIARFVFYYQATPNFVTKSMVEINPPSIKQPRSKMKVFGHHTYGDWKKIQLPHDWRRNVLSRHKIGNGKVSVTTRLVTKTNLSPCKLRLKKSNHHKIGNWILVIAGFCDNWKNHTTIKKIWLPILWQLTFLVTNPTTTKKCQSCDNWNSFLDIDHNKGNLGENNCFHALVLMKTIDTSGRMPIWCPTQNCHVTWVLTTLVKTRQKKMGNTLRPKKKA